MPVYSLLASSLQVLGPKLLIVSGYFSTDNLSHQHIPSEVNMVFRNRAKRGEKGSGTFSMSFMPFLPFFSAGPYGEGRLQAEAGRHAIHPRRAAERLAAGNAPRQGLVFLRRLRAVDPLEPIGRPAARRAWARPP